MRERVDVRRLMNIIEGGWLVGQNGWKGARQCRILMARQASPDKRRRTGWGAAHAVVKPVVIVNRVMALRRANESRGS